MDGGIRWYYGPIALTLSMSFLAVRAMREGFWSSKSAPVLLLIALAGTCYFRTVLGRSEVEHIFYGVLFALLLAIFLADRLLAASWNLLKAQEMTVGGWVVALTVLICGIAVSAGLISFCNISYQPLPALRASLSRLKPDSRSTELNPSELPRIGKAEIPKDQEATIRGVSEYIREHTRPGEPVFDFSNQAGFLFFAGRSSATRYFQAVYASPPEIQEEIVHDLAGQRTSLVIFKTGGGLDDIDGVPAEVRLPLIAQYLKTHHEYAGKIGQVIFLKIKTLKLEQ